MKLHSTKHGKKCAKKVGFERLLDVAGLRYEASGNGIGLWVAMPMITPVQLNIAISDSYPLPVQSLGFSSFFGDANLVLCPVLRVFEMLVKTVRFGYDVTTSKNLPLFGDSSRTRLYVRWLVLVFSNTC